MRESIIKEFLLNDKYWEETYNKMSSKKGITKADKNELWVHRNVYKEDIVNEIMTGTYKWSTPRRVEIAKHESNKRRVVYIYNLKDRYVIGVLYRVISDVFRDKVSDRCFSYKTGESTSHAIEYIKYNRKEKDRYGVKVDIHAYFNSVNREKVRGMIEELFEGGLLDTFRGLMLDDTVEWRGKQIQEWKSLIPGSAIGSFFANYCLKECDEYFDNKGITYARYSDDIVVLEDSKEKVEEDIGVILKYLGEYGLTMNPDKYTWFTPGDSIEYLGLKLNDRGVVDISDHAKFKIKKQIHRWCRKGRMEIERDGKQFRYVAERIIRRINMKNLYCAIYRDEDFGWAVYAFPRITTTESLKEIDLYTKDTIRALKTGKHNKANYKVISEEEFKELGWISLVEMYELYKRDYDYFMEIVELHSSEGPVM